MGAIAEAMAAYVQPLIDETDGSVEQMDRAFVFGQLCWSLALLPEEESEETLGNMRQHLNITDEEFEEFQDSVVVPMVQRHYELFPHMHGLDSMDTSSGASIPEADVSTPASGEKYLGTGRNAPCPCNSGKKYKRCCGRTS